MFVCGNSPAVQDKRKKKTKKHHPLSLPAPTNTQRGFPYVSILDGGFVATHAYLLQRTRERNSGLPTTAPPGLGLSALIDHVPNHCRMCKHEALLRFQR